jgi:uncharacterized protein YuzE
VRVTYDVSADAAYICLDEEDLPVAMTYGCDPLVVNGQIQLDFGADGHLIGIEVLDASRLLPPNVVARAEKL